MSISRKLEDSAAANRPADLAVFARRFGEVRAVDRIDLDAVGKDFGNGLGLGVVGYDYRQLSDDTGAGVPAILDGFKGEKDAIGPGLTYTTQIGKIPFILNARYYQDFNVKKMFDNSVTIICGTFVF